jgi:hypothetical protein
MESVILARRIRTNACVCSAAGRLKCHPGEAMRPCLATLLLSVSALDGLAVSPRWAAVRTQLAARRTPAAAAARMGIGNNGTNAGGQLDPVAAAKAAMEQRTRQARREQEEAQEAWRVKQAREAEQQAQAQARRDKVAETEVYGLSAADQAKASLEAMFSIDPTEAAAAEAVELATDSTADAERGAAAAAREREMAERDLAAASRRNDPLAVRKATERLAAAAAAAEAAKAAGGAAKGDMSSALSQQARLGFLDSCPPDSYQGRYDLGTLGRHIPACPRHTAGGDGGGCGGQGALCIAGGGGGGGGGRARGGGGHAGYGGLRRCKVAGDAAAALGRGGEHHGQRDEHAARQGGGRTRPQCEGLCGRLAGLLGEVRACAGVERRQPERCDGRSGGAVEQPHPAQSRGDGRGGHE